MVALAGGSGSVRYGAGVLRQLGAGGQRRAAGLQGRRKTPLYCRHHEWEISCPPNASG